MKWARQLYVGAVVIAVGAAACGGTPMPEASDEAAMPAGRPI